LIELVGLESVAKKRAGQFSLGMTSGSESPQLSSAIPRS
jgi:hypothetical protein